MLRFAYGIASAAPPIRMPGIKVTDEVVLLLCFSVSPQGRYGSISPNYFIDPNTVTAGDGSITITPWSNWDKCTFFALFQAK